MSPTGLSIGFFSPQSEIGDVARLCARIREICAPSSQGFPFACSPVKDERGQVALSYGVIRGHVPVHIDRPNAAESCSTLFTFVLEAENRPVLLFAPAGREQARCVFVPDEVKAPRMAFGAVELWAGKALYFDIARAFHGVTGFPTGDLVAEFPEAVIVQVPWQRADDIAGALDAMKSTIRRDERFSDMIPGEIGHA